MSHPTPLRSFIGGLCLPVPVQSLLLLNGNVFGISGFIHRAAKGNLEGAAGVVGLLLGGMLVAALDGQPPSAMIPSLPYVAVSGFLVGLGTKLSNGCTSGHMICGLSRCSLRSFAATLSFFTTGVLTAQVFHRDLPAVGSFDWTLGQSGARYLLAQALPLAASILLYALPSKPDTILKKVPTSPPPKNASRDEGSTLLEASSDTPNLTETEKAPNAFRRALAFLVNGAHFGLALQLSNLTDPLRVLSFLLLPFHRAFDPSLAFLAVGAMPLAMYLYFYARGNEVPRLGGKWSVPKAGEIDLKLVGGAAIFGIGWGLAGVCPGPAVVNLGRAIVGKGDVKQLAAWVGAMVAGGLLV